MRASDQSLFIIWLRVWSTPESDTPEASAVKYFNTRMLAVIMRAQQLHFDNEIDRSYSDPLITN